MRMNEAGGLCLHGKDRERIPQLESAMGAETRK